MKALILLFLIGPVFAQEEYSGDDYREERLEEQVDYQEVRQEEPAEYQEDRIEDREDFVDY